MTKPKQRKPTFLTVVRAMLRSDVLRKRLEAIDLNEGWNEKDALCAMLLAMVEHCQHARLEARRGRGPLMQHQSMEVLQARYEEAQKALAKVDRLLQQATR